MVGEGGRESQKIARSAVKGGAERRNRPQARVVVPACGQRLDRRTRDAGSIRQVLIRYALARFSLIGFEPFSQMDDDSCLQFLYW
jgi:hypothetical protein